MTLEAVRTNHRLGQWNRWQVYASVQPRHLTKRRTILYPTRRSQERPPNVGHIRHIGTVYAESRSHALQLAKQALHDRHTVRQLDRLTKLAKLTANPPTEQEFQSWLRQISNGSVRPTCGPLLDAQGYAIACFVPC